jgi:Sec-independent protein translocase protein TatA
VANQNRIIGDPNWDAIDGGDPDTYLTDQQIAAQMGGRVVGNQIQSPGPYSGFRGGNIPVYTPITESMRNPPDRGGGLVDRLEEAMLGPDGDYNRLVQAEQVNRGDILNQRAGLAGTIAASPDRIRGASDSSARALDRIANDDLPGIGRGMERDFARDSDKIMGTLDRQNAGAVSELERAYGQSDAAIGTMGSSIDEFRGRTEADTASLTSGVDEAYAQQSRTVEANQDLTVEQKAALKYQMFAQKMPQKAQIISQIHTQFRNSLADMQGNMARLQQAASEQKSQGAALKASMASNRAGTAAELARTRVQVNDNLSQISQARAQINQAIGSLRQGAEQVASQYELEGRMALAEYTRGSPLSPVSMAASIAQMLAARSIPNQQSIA